MRLYSRLVFSFVNISLTDALAISAATYGGHLELSAFAHMTKRNVKVIQPGLVYVIEWAAGGDFDETPAAQDDDVDHDDREKRRQRRERRRSETGTGSEETEPSTTSGTVYVAYVSPNYFDQTSF